MKIWFRYISLVLVVASLTACGYQLRGRGTFLPPQIKKVCVPVFKNSSGRYELDLKLTKSVIDELVSRTGVVIEPDRDRADGVLTGEITSFKVEPIDVSEVGAARRYKITISTKVVFTDLVDQKIIFSNDNFNYVDNYDVPEGVDYETAETQAIDRLAGKYAQQLVVSLLEGF
ncbi:MAG: LPS assembly lipoprotein LptE [Candidatus Saccharicenans sp.]|nr:MAG: hypothetical protein C0168_02225 [Candidatus Aminicenantes bacterium]HEK85027.1 hypothetical protein [Candidatus Aminicenantes bacterium]